MKIIGLGNRPNLKENLNDVIKRIVAFMALVLEISKDKVDIQTSFVEQGLDSLKLQVLVAELSSVLGQQISPTLFFKFPNVISLAEHVTGLSSNKNNLSSTKKKDNNNNNK